MANIVITSVGTKTYFNVDFGVYNDKLGADYELFWADDIKNIKKNSTSGNIEVIMKGDTQPWIISFDGGSESLQVDKVLGTPPTDNDHLATLIANLKG
jgi:hypothetical protein